MTPVHASTDPAPVVDAAWVWRSRWLVAVTHLMVVGWSVLQDLAISWPLVLGTLLISLLSNGWASLGHRSASASGAAWLLTLDLVLLTLLLHGCGGHSHPFTFLYLFQVVIAAMVLETNWVWALVTLAALSYGSLFVPTPLTPPVAHVGHEMPGGSMHDHYIGMWVAFGVTGPFAAFVVTRVRQALAEATARIQHARRLQERTERLTALGTLAAGTAHELATPLASIAVVAGDLARSPHPEVAEDGTTIRAQVQRCRDVLAQLASDSGHGVGQRPETLTGAALVQRVVDGLTSDRLDLTVDASAQTSTATLPVDRVAQAIRQLIMNALDATEERVTLKMEVDNGQLRARVTDEGTGMPTEVLARATEPFFTTKPLGHGSGLGLHFVRSIAEQVGGDLVLESVEGSGTTATLTLPTHQEVL